MKISIITPSLNNALFLPKAIESVLEQGYENFEHIVVDGASTDATVDILGNHRHVRWISEPDRGQSDALNKGMSMAEGDVVAILNADDSFLPGAFEAVATAFETGASFVVGDVKVVSSRGEEKVLHPETALKEMLYHWKPWKQLHSNHFSSPFPNNPVQYFYRRELHDQIRFDVDNHLTMDLEFLLEAADRVEFTKIDAVLGVYALHPEAKTEKAKVDERISYWSAETFAYLDDYLKALPAEEIIAFKNAQMRGYRERIFPNPKEAEKMMRHMAWLEKLPFKKHPLKKLLGFKKLLELYREVY